jgi:hypothetical protein
MSGNSCLHSNAIEIGSEGEDEILLLRVVFWSILQIILLFIQSINVPTKWNVHKKKRFVPIITIPHDHHCSDRGPICRSDCRHHHL